MNLLLSWWGLGWAGIWGAGLDMGWISPWELGWAGKKAGLSGDWAGLGWEKAEAGAVLGWGF